MGEYLFPIVIQYKAPLVRLEDGKEEHVLDIGGGHYTPALAHRPSWSDPDLLLHFSTDDGFCLMGINGVTRVTCRRWPKNSLTTATGQ